MIEDAIAGLDWLRNLLSRRERDARIYYNTLEELLNNVYSCLSNYHKNMLHAAIMIDNGADLKEVKNFITEARTELLPLRLKTRFLMEEYESELLYDSTFREIILELKRCCRVFGHDGVCSHFTNSMIVLQDMLDNHLENREDNSDIFKEIAVEYEELINDLTRMQTGLIRWIKDASRHPIRI